MLNKFFAPAMAIMSRLRFALKLGLVGLLFLAPLVVLVVYLYGKLDAEIRSTETERLGAQQEMAARMVVQWTSGSPRRQRLSPERRSDGQGKACDCSE